MATIYNAIHLEKTAAQLYAFVTTPANWPQWHPASLSVSSAANHTLARGEQVTEAFCVAGQHGQVVWTVRAADAPRLWVIDGQIKGSRVVGTITYTLTPTNTGTLFEREFTYTMPNLMLQLLDWLFLRRRVEAESDEALRRLKAEIEHSGYILQSIN